MERDITKILMDIGAVALRVEPPFTWASGRFSPIYCDNRLIMSAPSSRKQVAAAFVEMIEANGWRPEVIAGTATAGIPHAAWVSDLMDLPMIYVRSATKGHGKGNRIEGKLDSGKRVVLIEDLISTGGSSLDAAQAVIDAGGALLGVAAIFTYGLPVAASRFEEAKIRLSSLTNFNALMDEARAAGSLSASQKAIIAEWQRDPSAWSSERGGAS